jgi:hypothetical protein
MRLTSQQPIPPEQYYKITTLACNVPMPIVQESLTAWGNLAHLWWTFDDPQLLDSSDPREVWEAVITLLASKLSPEGLDVWCEIESDVATAFMGAADQRLPGSLEKLLSRIVDPITSLDERLLEIHGIACAMALVDQKPDMRPIKVKTRLAEDDSRHIATALELLARWLDRQPRVWPNDIKVSYLASERRESLTDDDWELHIEKERGRMWSEVVDAFGPLLEQSRVPYLSAEIRYRTKQPVSPEDLADFPPAINSFREGIAENNKCASPFDDGASLPILGHIYRAVRRELDRMLGNQRRDNSQYVQRTYSGDNALNHAINESALERGEDGRSGLDTARPMNPRVNWSWISDDLVQQALDIVDRAIDGLKPIYLTLTRQIRSLSEREDSRAVWDELKAIRDELRGDLNRKIDKIGEHARRGSKELREFVAMFDDQIATHCDSKGDLDGGELMTIGYRRLVELMVSRRRAIQPLEQNILSFLAESQTISA